VVRLGQPQLIAGSAGGRGRTLPAAVLPGDHVVLHDTPVGRLTLAAGDAGVTAILWPGETAPRGNNAAHAVLDETRRQLDAYFAGTRRRFELPLAPRGTPFQRSVWDALATINYAETRSYAAIARMIARPAAVRAVGAANGRNPISIVLPCHRVVGSDGSLTGFAGGLAAKRFLLTHEGIIAPSLL